MTDYAYIYLLELYDLRPDLSFCFQVRQEARHSIELMDAAGNGVDIFDCLWMTPMPFVRKYDEVFQFVKVIRCT